MPVTATPGVPDAWIATQPDADQPLLRAAWAGLAEDTTGNNSIGLAVSGGGDSMALLHLMAEMAARFGLRVEVATIDHGLRPEAAAEAAFVAEVCKALGLAHVTLPWADHPETGNLMQAASLARRTLLAGWARARGLSRVAMAHTADDLAESFLMSLARGTGLDGLCGMRRHWQEGGVGFVRPLLDLTRAELRAYLERHQREWCEDPTNEDDRYTRSRARKALALLEPLGITTDRLTETMRNLADVRATLQMTLADFTARAVVERAGSLELSLDDYRDLAPELRRRLLVAMIRWMSGARHPPRADQVQTLSLALRDQTAATLGGCRFVVEGTRLRVSREASAAQGRVPAGSAWDHRWRVAGDGPPGMEIGALGEEGLRQCPQWRETGIGREVLLVTPGLWLGDRLIAAPCADFGPATATCAPNFHSFLLSH